jgi:hypothetical protein
VLFRSDNVIIATVNTKPKGVLELYTIADSIQFIRLDNSDDALIGRVSSVYFSDSLMFVHDRKGRSILIFDKTGGFKYKIFNIGRASGEYLYASYLMVDDDKRQLMLYDIGLRKMIFYNFKGEYIKEINNFNEGHVFRDIINLSNGNFLCYRYDLEKDYGFHGLWETDSMGNYIRHLLKPDIEYPYIESEDPSFLYNVSDNKIGLMSVENDIYHYENDTLKKFITYNLDGINILNFPGEHKTRERFNRILSNFEKNNYLLTEWLSDKNKYFISLYSCIEKSIISFEAIDYESNINGIIGHSIHSNLTDALLFVIPAGTVNTILNDNYVSEEIKDQLRNLLLEMSEEEIEDMNPILEIVYIKK